MLMKAKGHINKSFLFLYRMAAVVILYGVLIAVGSYLFVQGFYAVNHSWIAPMIVSPSNDAILQMTAQLVNTKSQLDGLVLDRNRLQDSLGTMRRQVAELHDLNEELNRALLAKTKDDDTNGGELAQLIEQKRQDITKTNPVIQEVLKTDDEIEKDLKAGVITKSDAATQRAALRQFSNTLTDSKVNEVLLRDSVRQHTTKDIDTLEILSKQSDLKSQIATLNVNLAVGEQQFKSDEDQIMALIRAIRTAHQSPFYSATQISDKIRFGFVPYENEDGVHVGSRVYDCYLNMVFCRDVGTVQAIYADEQKTTHPLFHTDLRGFLVQLELNNSKSAESKTLFVNGKPLGI